jgi:hypothetical protein
MHHKGATQQQTPIAEAKGLRASKNKPHRCGFGRGAFRMAKKVKRSRLKPILRRQRPYFSTNARSYT